ncbi:MAG: hypothetical protein M3401_12595 [Actinomycetota bacterium]|nr:hypothetical protein [Actinomycetota bacterium]
MGTVLKVTLGVIFGGLVLIVGCSALISAGTDEVGQEDTNADSPRIKVEDSRLIYEPDQTGGRFHEGFVVVRNPSDKPIQVEGQVSVKDGGQLVESYEPAPTVILPRSRGVLVESALDLPKPVTHGKLETKLVSTPVNEADPAPRVKFSKLRYRPDDIVGCALSGTVTHNLDEPTEVRVNAIGRRGREIVTGGFTFVDKVFPRTPATFKIDIASPALCPARVDRIEAFWDPGADGLSG